MPRDDANGTRWFSVAALLTLLLGLSLAAGVLGYALAEQLRPEPAEYVPCDLAVTASHAGASKAPSYVQGAADAWFSAYVNARKQEAYKEERPARFFGPWFAEPDPEATDARADGSITEWAPNYYITHDWSDYGQQILSMTPGDEVQINGKSFVVFDIFNYPKDSYLDEILQIVGSGSVVFQTCLPNSDLNRIVFGW